MKLDAKPLCLLALFLLLTLPGLAAPDPRPNIVFAIADDWGWPHASAYGDPVVKTPNFDRLAREGVLFQNAFVSSPSCTPSRNAILTGQYHWRLGSGGNLWSTLDTKHQTTRSCWKIRVSPRVWRPMLQS